MRDDLRQCVAENVLPRLNAPSAPQQLHYGWMAIGSGDDMSTEEEYAYLAFCLAVSVLCSSGSAAEADLHVRSAVRTIRPVRRGGRGRSGQCGDTEENRAP